jgi:hypothetical protein
MLVAASTGIEYYYILGISIGIYRTGMIVGNLRLKITESKFRQESFSDMRFPRTCPFGCNLLGYERISAADKFSLKNIRHYKDFGGKQNTDSIFVIECCFVIDDQRSTSGCGQV